MKYKIYRRYTPIIGTWYVIKKRRFIFWWCTYNTIFYDLDIANEILKSILDGYDEKEKICETPLIYKKEKEKFIEKYPCKTNLIKF